MLLHVPKSTQRDVRNEEQLLYHRRTRKESVVAERRTFAERRNIWRLRVRKEKERGPQGYQKKIVAKGK